MENLGGTETIQYRIWNNADLVPAEWANAKLKSDGFYTFNPTISREQDGSYLMFYRLVGRGFGRKIGACRLDGELNVIPGSVCAFSDRIRFPEDTEFTEQTQKWHADPRIFILGDHYYVYWNDGAIAPNNQFVIQLCRETLQPIGYPLHLVKQVGRRPVEKNWGLFYEDGIKAVYSNSPHRVINLIERTERGMTFDLGSHVPTPLAGAAEGLEELRGGAQPVWHDGQYFNFCHTVAVQEAEDGTRSRVYTSALYTFADGASGHRVLRVPARPLDLPNPHGADHMYRRLNAKVDRVVYISGAVRVDGGWAISYGINDERCALCILPDREVDACLR